MNSLVGRKAPLAHRVLGSQHPAIRYAFAVLVAGLVTAAAVAARPLIEALPSPPFLLAILVVAWLAGFGRR
jgi:hypothetical protein